MHQCSLPLTFLDFSQVLEATLTPAGNAAWSPASRQLAVAQRPLSTVFAVSCCCLTTWNGTIIGNVSYCWQLCLCTKQYQVQLERASCRSCHACCTKLRLFTILLLWGLSQLCLCLLRIRSLCVYIACDGTHASGLWNHPFSLGSSCAMRNSELYVAAAFSCNIHALPHHTEDDMHGGKCRH